MKSVAIVGGGITGLTAAFRLKERGIAVTIYEASERVGGVIRSIRKDGFLAEFGPNTVLETSPKITQLIADIGLASKKLATDPAANERYLVRDKKTVALPDSPPAFFKSKLFSTRTKLRLFAEPFIRRAPADLDEPLAVFVLRRLGREFLDYAINPMVAGVYAGSPEKLSVKWAFPKLWALEQRYSSLILGQIFGARARKRAGSVSKANAPKFSFDTGLAALVDALRETLEGSIRFSSPVRRVAQQGKRWTVSVEGAGEFEHDCVILAAPAHKLAGLEIVANEKVDLSALGEIVYPPVASVVLGYRRAEITHPLDGFGMLIPEVEKFNSLGVIFSSSLFPNRAPQGHVALTCYIGGMRAPALASKPPEMLCLLAHQDISTILGASGGPVFSHVTFYDKAIPQYNVGYGRFKDLLTETERRAPGLFFAGHYRDGISLGDSIVSGHDMALKIAAL
jgi:oxygen-dependent protoporphyrinogen oxidase